MSDEARVAHIARTPLGRVGTPADIASVAVFLASDEARWLDESQIGQAAGTLTVPVLARVKALAALDPCGAAALTVCAQVRGLLCRPLRYLCSG